MHKILFSILVLLLTISPCFGQPLNVHHRTIWEGNVCENFSDSDDGAAEWLGFYKDVSLCNYVTNLPYDDNMRILVVGDSIMQAGDGAASGCTSIGDFISASLGVRVDIEAVAGASLVSYITCSSFRGIYKCAVTPARVNSQYDISNSKGNYDWIVMDNLYWDTYWFETSTPGLYCYEINQETECHSDCSTHIETTLVNTTTQKGFVYDFLDDMLVENTNNVRILYMGYYRVYGSVLDNILDCLLSHVNPQLSWVANNASSNYKNYVFYVDSNIDRPVEHKEYFMQDTTHPQYLMRKEIAAKLIKVINENRLD